MPDAFTALTLTPIGNDPLPIRGTDGKYHVAYDLHVMNATHESARLDKIDVVDGFNPEFVIASFSGTSLVDPSCSFGDYGTEILADADDFLSGTFLGGKLAKPEPRTSQLPLNLAIVDFP